jgi:hypothetical protein
MDYIAQMIALCIPDAMLCVMSASGCQHPAVNSELCPHFLDVEQ